MSAPPDRRASDLANYRRDLGVLGISRSSAGAGAAQNSNANIAPWASNAPPPPPPKGPVTSFYDDSSDSLSLASQFSPSLLSASQRHGPVLSGNPESPDMPYFNPDGRRPSIASITTTASSHSRTSVTRGGFRKLQGFFGEEFPGRDSSESSLPMSVAGKDQRTRSYSHTHPNPRDRNYSNATDTRDASPASSRPRTPKPEVVPFLYQDNSVRLPCPACATPLPPLVPSSASVPSSLPHSLGSRDKRLGSRHCWLLSRASLALRGATSSNPFDSTRTLHDTERRLSGT